MNEHLTDERLAELRRAVEVVATAPWDAQGGYPAGLIAPDGTLGSRSLSGAQLADAVSIVVAVLDEVERLRSQLTITDEMVKRGALAMHQITCDTDWRECSHAGPAGCMAIARKVLEAAIGGGQR